MKNAFLVFILSCLLFGYDENMLKQENLQLFNISKANILAQEKVQNYSLLAKPIISYKKDISDNTSILNISIKQDIFRSGGLYYSIKEAHLKTKYNLLSVDIKKQEDIFKAYKNAVDIKKIQLSLQKQTFLISNKNYLIKDIKAKQSKGLESTSNMSNALIELHILQNNIYNLENTKSRLIHTWGMASSKNYNNISLISFDESINQEKFILNNIYIKIANSSKNYKELTTKKAISSFLPRVELYANSSIINNNTKNTYGIQGSWVLNVGAFSSIELSSLNNLQTKIELKKIIQNEKSLFKYLKNTISIINTQIKNAKSNIKYYQALSKEEKLKYNQGLISRSRLNISINTTKMAKVDLQIFLLNKNLKLLEIYQRIGKKVVNDT